MQRRTLRLATLMIAAGLPPSCAPAARDAATPAADEAAIRQTIVDWYAAYSGTDEARYRAFVTSDYVLLEDGDPMGIEDDVKAMRTRPAGYRRADRVDFKSIVLHGDIAYTWYFLASEIADAHKVEQRRWLESAVLRRVDGRWRTALLHSTRIGKSGTP